MSLPKFNIRCIIPSSRTGGMLAAFEERDAPGEGPPLHVHRTQTEIFHVIDGKFLFAVGDERLTLTAGGCAVVPPGVAHTFKNIGEGEGCLHFEVLPPDNVEEFFARLVEGKFDPGKVAEFFGEYGMDIAGPPL